MSISAIPTPAPSSALRQARAAVEARTAALESRRHRLQQRRRALGYAIVLAAALFAAVAFANLTHAAPGWPVALAAAVTLLLIVLWQQLLRPLTRIDRLRALYHDALARMDGNAPTASRGEQFRRPAHPYERDLSILGEHSLFAHLPPTRTEAGAAALATLLLDSIGAATVLERQASVQALAPNLDLRERIALIGPTSFRGISAGRVRTWANTPVLALPRAASVALLLTSLGNVLLALAAFTHRLTWPLALRNIAALAAVEAVIALSLRARVAASLEAADRLAPEITLLREAVTQLASDQTHTPQLDRIRTAVLGDTSAAKPLAQLDARLSLVEQRHQQWFLIASLLFAAGTQSAIALEHWRARHGSALIRWLDAWAQFDALNALAAYTFEHPHHTFPTIDPTGPAHFEATGLRHPLLPPARAVGNTITLNGETRFLLISGSNMSGKSTLLRAIGSAVVLAYAGAPIPCTAARLSMLRLCASITPQDSLAEARSRFLAELEQLHAMLRPSPDTPPTLFLIDEILGGTNSADRLAAARSILHRLLAEAAIGALSTHDLALTPIADDPTLHGRNCHMSSPDPADPLRFDFILRPGTNTISSAPALLRLLGL